MIERLARISAALRVGLRFTQHLREHRKALWLAASTMLFAALLEIVRPWPVQWIVDGPLDPSSSSSLSNRFIIIGGALTALVVALTRAACDYFGVLKMTEVGHGVTRSLRLDVFRHLSELSPSFHAKNKSGDLLVRLMGDVPMLRTMLVDSTIMLATRVVLVVGTSVVMFLLDPLLAACVLMLVPAVVVITRTMSQRVTVAVRKQRKKEGDLADFLQEAIVASPVIQSLGGSGQTVRRFARSNRRSARAGMKAARAAARLALSVESTLAVATAGTLALGAWRVTEGHLKVGELIVFLSYTRSIAKPARSASKHMAKIAKGTACGERILRILDEKQGVRQQSGVEQAPQEPNRLQFDGVSYSYEGGSQALTDVSVEFRRGELTALFGPSGAGKSTVTCLALRLFDPTKGAVRLDGVNLAEFDLDSLRDRFALSMQDTVLLGESVRDNLALGRPDATEEEMLRALTAAGAEDYVLNSPEGLDSLLGSSGSGFSGGQRKRLCLARALLRESPIVIVDEPFSGLDADSAKAIAATLSGLARDRIVVVITHDTNRLVDFDRVVYLEEGRVRGDGSHSELSRSSTEYARITSSTVVA